MASLLLSGWAQPADALSVLDGQALTFDYSAFAPEKVMQQLAQFKNVDSIIAWSLGGQIALNAIAEGVLSPKHLTLIATPYQFVSGNNIKGMDPLTFEQFRNNYVSNPARTKTRFHGLVAKGDKDAAEVLQSLQHHPEVEVSERWLPWLDYLAQAPASAQNLTAIPSTLIVHGTEDVVVPVSQTQFLQKALPNTTVQLWQDVGHAPHLHNTQKLQAAITEHRTKAGA